MGIEPFFSHRRPLLNPEAVLFVNHGQTQALQFNVTLNDGVGTNQDIDLSSFFFTYIKNFVMG